MPNTRRTFLSLAGAALAAPATLRRAAGQSAERWPAYTIRVMLPFSAGSSTDIVGRIVAEQLSTQLGVPVVVENRGGAGGTIGTAVVAKAKPDGYQLLVNASAHSSAPAAYPNITYDPAADFTAIAPFGIVPNVLVISPEKGIKTAQELAEAAKKSGTFTYSSAGIGSATHWAAERFRLSAGFKATHIPFRGGPEATTEVLTGRVDFVCMGISACIEFIRDGRLLPLAVSTPQRSVTLPDVPTTLEAGFPDSDYTYWIGLFAPAKTPAAIVERLGEETRKALADPQVQERFKPQGLEPMPLSSAEFDALIRREIAANIALAKAAGLKFN